ncbi:hypothetical protein FOQG_09062 [Fusarium oxysporum f. sp. raphani 54005]|jgi:hypothetical protein|uniref:Uncharacterized protein n=2 Tax=Fusarium oxysporum TaxID=5507 RepID=X0C947_FUSOX|nr:hypothetical protein FOVG_12271 [Fusarium oxysporum f. sp. pisi HDV247]EXK87723.1 hypothetical protein FOQG_09062 [Fusarium oxysporum f. sp. raphani 54005]
MDSNVSRLNLESRLLVNMCSKISPESKSEQKIARILLLRFMNDGKDLSDKLVLLHNYSSRTHSKVKSYQEMNAEL